MKRENKVDKANVQKLEEELQKEIKKIDESEESEQTERPEWCWLND